MTQLQPVKTTDYSIFSRIFTGEELVFHTDQLNRNNIIEYIHGLMNIFRDFIERKELETVYTKIIFNDELYIELALNDTLINFSLWSMILRSGNKVLPKHIFFQEKGITNKEIKLYIDKYFIVPNRSRLDFFDMNNIIYETLRILMFVDDFALYFNNSLNIEDFIEMSLRSEEFNDILTMDYSKFPVDTVKEESMKKINRLFELIIDSENIMGREHCITDMCRAKEGINMKQAREAFTAIGPKPNGEGTLFPYSIDTSYLRGGLNTIEYMVCASSVARQAQIICKKATADSGSFGRILNLNSMESKLYTKLENGVSVPDPDYDCGTRNYILFKVDSIEKLKMIADRYYRFDPKGMEFCTGDFTMMRENHAVLGKTIYLRSPMTCSSAAKGLGICRKCYGELYHINSTGINIGKVATETINSKLSQTMLSAKHVLDAKLKIPTWTYADTKINNFSQYFEIDNGSISVNYDLDTSKDVNLIIDLDDIDTEVVLKFDSDEPEVSEDDEVREFVTMFKLSIDGEEHVLHSDDCDQLFFTPEFVKYAYTNKYKDDNSIVVPLKNMLSANNDICIFDMNTLNDDIMNKLKNIENTINIKHIVEGFDKDSFLNTFIDNMLISGLNDIQSVHAEIILMNQIRDADDILATPDWDSPNPKYQLLMLKKALDTNPSVAISLQFDNINRTLSTPLTFKKRKPSILDLGYHVQPKMYLEGSNNDTVKTVQLASKISM